MVFNMILPPGLTYLLRLFPFFALPSAAVYSGLRLFASLFDTALPIWLTTTATLLAKPTLFFCNRYYQKIRDSWDASSNNAMLVPYVPESAFSAISRLRASKRVGYPGEVFQGWAEEHGNVVQFDIITSSSIITVEPDHLKAMLSTKVQSFEKGLVLRNQMDSLLGTGIFNTDGEMWKFHRSITRPFFSRDRISDFKIYERNCGVSLREARSRLAEGYSVDFQDLVSRFTLDSATEFLFGVSVGSLSAGIPYPPSSMSKNPASFYNHPSNVFVQAFMEGQARTAVRYSMGAEWPLGEFWNDQVLSARKIMDEFTEPLTQKALADREKRLLLDKNNEGDEVTLLDHLVNHTQDPRILKDELINLLVAGRDTTMCLLTFSLYMLTEHPEIERKLRQEIYEKVGPSANPTSDQIHDMKYMRAFLNEVLRLYPPVPINMRSNKEAVTLPNSDRSRKPFHIPIGTRIFYPVINIHRRTDLWGPDALEFDPDRFLDSRLQRYFTPNPYIFCPFNAGPRICIGQQFAYHEATFYLVRLLQLFTGFKLDAKTNVQPPKEWKSCKGLKATEKVHIMAHLTMYIKGGLWVTMQELTVTDSS
ncbi:cytochrome P450 monooxygenase pc-2 [Pholiota conissans]|uniref:Cytochrome P450 monooxygenase pc-2 n=1 Tax=Pholiota conissans TaxID=109636 RepID=A0A9P6CRI2_9AGAR|nr:cytochrome P450 monooxygenase pc-2 [Pholiota conissans]